jgi:hypothetical protein
MFDIAKRVYVGLESQGKSLALANDALMYLARSVRLEKRYGFRRLLYSNMTFSKEVMARYGERIRYYSRVDELLSLTGCDIIIDELPSFFSALKTDPLPYEVNRWLRQTAKQGVRITGTAQEFHDIHVQFRRRVISASRCFKVLGSTRPGHNLPPVRSVWGIVRIRPLVINPYDELKPQYSFTLPPFDCLFITRSLVSVFDTNQVIGDASYTDFRHVERFCPVCKFKKIYHY